jgi:predicted TIM-barrel fold metal-dependent hydrolase
VSIFDLPKIDGHCHVLDPRRFPYKDDVAYRPWGQEIGRPDYFTHVMDTYGVRHAVLVGPNSGYGTDNRCLLDSLARYPERFRGIAVVPNDASLDALQTLKAQGVIGIAFNFALHGLGHYADIGPLLSRMAALGLMANLQVSGDQIHALRPLLSDSGVRVLIDHCGRPVMADGPQAPGVQTLLQMGRQGEAVVKVSGFYKFSQHGFPFDDARNTVFALLDAFGPERCIWASDWPYLRAEDRLDYGTMLTLTQRWLGDDTCAQIMWKTPAQLFGW